jgi:hypothetical protein
MQSRLLLLWDGGWAIVRLIPQRDAGLCNVADLAGGGLYEAAQAVGEGVRRATGDVVAGVPKAGMVTKNGGHVGGLAAQDWGEGVERCAA